MTDAEQRLEKALPEILRLLSCVENKQSDVQDFILWLCHEFPNVEKHYRQAPNRASLNKNITAASDLADKLVTLISNDKLRGAVHFQAFKDALMAGEEHPSFSEWEDSIRRLARHLKQAVDELPPTSKGDNKPLGGLPPKQWVIVMIARLFEEYTGRQAAAKDTNFLNLVNHIWFIITGDTNDLDATVRRAMPEIEQWHVAMRETPLTAARTEIAKAVKKKSQ